MRNRDRVVPTIPSRDKGRAARWLSLGFWLVCGCTTTPQGGPEPAHPVEPSSVQVAHAEGSGSSVQREQASQADPSRVIPAQGEAPPVQAALEGGAVRNQGMQAPSEPPGSEPEADVRRRPARLAIPTEVGGLPFRAAPSVADPCRTHADCAAEQTCFAPEERPCPNNPQLVNCPVGWESNSCTCVKACASSADCPGGECNGSYCISPRARVCR